MAASSPPSDQTPEKTPEKTSERSPEKTPAAAPGAAPRSKPAPSASRQRDSSRPLGHYDSPVPDPSIVQPKLGVVGYLRFFWRQLTSMRTALFLLLLLAFAAVPGSLVPQISSDPNGVIQYKAANPQLSKVLDSLGVFSTYTSVWFSAIYLLLFISLVGCIIPRTKHHIDALLSKPPKTPARLGRLAGYASTEPVQLGPDAVDAAIADARVILRRSGYRTRMFARGRGDGISVSAERGYLRETGNLVFHMALVGILFTVGFGGGFVYTGQKVVVVGEGFANVQAGYDSMSPGRWFNADQLQPYSLKLNKFKVVYENKNQNAIGEAIDYTASVTVTTPNSKPKKETIKVNSPLRVGGTDIYLLGNGYAPVITVRNPAGKVVYSQPIPFLPQNADLTSTGVVKIPDGLAKQVGMIGIFYPTAYCATSCKTDIPQSVHPDLYNPLLTLQVFTGNLGLDNGQATNAFALQTDHLKQIAGFGTKTPGLQLKVGKTVKLPNGLGTISMDRIPRYASLDIHHDPTQLWVLTFAILVLLGLLTGLFVPRRRVWVKAVETEEGVRFEYAGLARGEDPGLEASVAEIARKHSQQLGLTMKP